MIATAIILAVISAFGVVMLPLSIKELSDQADIIVQGVVTNKVCLQDETGRIYTRVDLQISEVLKGKEVGGSLSVVHGGGTVGDRRVEVSGQVEYESGQDVLAFLVLNPKGQAVTLGLCQGKFEIWQDGKSGEKFACNRFHGTPSSTSVETARQSVSSAPRHDRLGLSDLKEQIQQARP